MKILLFPKEKNNYRNRITLRSKRGFLVKHALNTEKTSRVHRLLYIK